MRWPMRHGGPRRARQRGHDARHSGEVDGKFRPLTYWREIMNAPYRIDVHQHVVPPFWAKALPAHGGDPRGTVRRSLQQRCSSVVA